MGIVQFEWTATKIVQQSFPHLNLIVVSRDTGLPGEGAPGKGMTPEQLLVEQARVFVFDWAAKDKPRSNSFDGL